MPRYDWANGGSVDAFLRVVSMILVTRKMAISPEEGMFFETEK